MSTTLAFLAFAAEAHEETSKTPFYVAGAIAAAYGVVIAAIGIAKHDFPATKGATRGVYALSALVVAATMVTSVMTG